MHVLSDPYIYNPKNALKVINNDGKELQKPLFDFLLTFFQWRPLIKNTQLFTGIISIWLTYIQPWKLFNSAKFTSFPTPLENFDFYQNIWISFIQQNVLFYTIFTREFLELASQFNCCCYANDLLLLEQFVDAFQMPEIVAACERTESLLIGESDPMFSNQIISIIQNHCNSLQINLSDYQPIFANASRASQRRNTPDSVDILLEILTRDYIEASANSPPLANRIFAVANKLATIFHQTWKPPVVSELVEQEEEDDRSFYQRNSTKPTSKSTRPAPPFGRRVTKSSYFPAAKNHRLQSVLNVSFRGGYWDRPITSYENAFLVHQSFSFALFLQKKYGLPEPPAIRWLANYTSWILFLLFVMILFVLWHFAVYLSSGLVNHYPQ